MGDSRNNDPAHANVSGLALALPAAVIAQTFIAAMMFAPAVLAPVAVGVPATAAGVVTAIIYLAAAMIAPVAGARVPRIGAVRVTQLGLLFAGAVVAPPLFALMLALTQRYAVGFTRPTGLASAGVASPLRRR